MSAWSSIGGFRRCPNATAFSPPAPLPATPGRPCDAPVFLIPHLPVSMSAMDMINALVLFVLLTAYLVRKPKRY